MFNNMLLKVGCWCRSMATTHPLPRFLIPTTAQKRRLNSTRSVKKTQRREGGNKVSFALDKNWRVSAKWLLHPTVASLSSSPFPFQTGMGTEWVASNLRIPNSSHPMQNPLWEGIQLARMLLSRKCLGWNASFSSSFHHVCCKNVSFQLFWI